MKDGVQMCNIKIRQMKLVVLELRQMCRGSYGITDYIFGEKW